MLRIRLITIAVFCAAMVGILIVGVTPDCLVQIDRKILSCDEWRASLPRFDSSHHLNR
jgi:hypothetical protein